MQELIDIGQAIGVGAGVGLLVAAVARFLPNGAWQAAAAMIGGAAGFALATGAIYPATVIAGGVIACVTAIVARRVIDPAAKSGGDGVSIWAGLAALVDGGASLVPYVGFAALALVAFLAVGARRAAQRKYAGLRVLR